MSNVSAISWREHVTFVEILMISSLIVLAYWNNSLRLDIVVRLGYMHYPYYEPTRLSFFLLLKWCVLSGEATNTILIVFGLTQIYHTRGVYTNHYTTAIYTVTFLFSVVYSITCTTQIFYVIYFQRKWECCMVSK